MPSHCIKGIELGTHLKRFILLIRNHKITSLVFQFIDTSNISLYTQVQFLLKAYFDKILLLNGSMLKTCNCTLLPKSGRSTVTGDWSRFIA